MKLMAEVKMLKRLLLAAALCGLGACAEDISNQTQTVKADLATAIKLLSQATASEVVVNAKASSVTATVAYEDANALVVKNAFAQIASKLSYDRPVTVDGRAVQCHQTGKARFLWLEVVHTYPLKIVMGASITGWQSDANMCNVEKQS